MRHRARRKDRQYGVPIGSATAHIARGEHVHVHNVRGFAGQPA
nr:SAF domain-containing protein [Bradyrhizobium brasilense]